MRLDKAFPPLSILRAILTAGENHERYAGTLVTRGSPLRTLSFYPHAVMRSGLGFNLPGASYTACTRLLAPVNEF